MAGLDSVLGSLRRRHHLDAARLVLHLIVLIPVVNVQLSSVPILCASSTYPTEMSRDAPSSDVMLVRLTFAVLIVVSNLLVGRHAATATEKS